MVIEYSTSNPFSMQDLSTILPTLPKPFMPSLTILESKLTTKDFNIYKMSNIVCGTYLDIALKSVHGFLKFLTLVMAEPKIPNFFKFLFAALSG